MFYVIATPIGNLADFTFRAVQTIQNCDYLLCEDTRTSRVLLNHYELKKPLRSYHKFNERARVEEVINDLKAGQIIGLLSDAGTPCISDPGFRIIEACRKHELPVTPIPGPSSVTAAISASGFNAARFQFVGFLPRKKGKLITLLEECLAYPGLTVAFESPYRLHHSLEALASLNPEINVCVAREITKKFEQFYRGTALELYTFFKEHPPKGECLFIIEGLEA
jgi:16S rRNA (cytidine1402-2'-O)-methyltransferase